MKNRTSILITAVTAAISTQAAPAADFTEAEKLFALQVKPILAEKCFSCHGADPDKIKGALILLDREAMLRGGETSTDVLVPGDAEKSLLYTATTWRDPDLEMPPKENDRLTEEQTWHLRDWINAGAPWPSDERVAAIVDEYAQGEIVKTSGGLSPDWDERRYEEENLWAYRELKKPSVPWQHIDGTSDAAHPIDAFVNRQLDELGVAPAPRADRRTLVRRATYDLTGLPPTPEEVDAFLNDPAPEKDAFAALVDRLLASPHYGERMARHWLDATRYADSSGFANDYERGTTWRYRDYVIRSFNNDKPYDQFVREQIAGDEIDASDPEMLVAAGFLRMGPWELTGMEVAKVARQRFLDDVTDTVGQVFLATPMQCARCHDHKFDPIPTRDYYRMQAVFATTQPVEREADFLPEENPTNFDEKKYLLERRERFSNILKDLRAKEEAAARKWYAERGLDYIARNEGLRKGVPEEKLVPKKYGFSVEDYGMERIARKGMERVKWQLDRYDEIAFSVYSGRTPKRNAVYAPIRMPEDRMNEGELEQTAILAGGDPFSRVQDVTPGVLSMLPGSDDAVEETPFNDVPDSIEGRRLALANWIASDRNPLAARTIVNRAWAWHFGQGIAGNPNNFGATGKKPSHPELLDWLAAKFIEDGRCFKRLHRLVMTSDAYQRASSHRDRETLAAKDPNGTSYAVFQPRRLTAEEFRDSMLAVSGELNREMGGAPIRPEMNLEAALQPRMVMGTFAEPWQPSPLPEQRHRRSIYALQIRGLRDPFMEVFNAPSPEAPCEARDASTVTPQVFSLFNGQSSYDRALAFATRALKEESADSEVVDRVFQLAFGRAPSERERGAALGHWKKMTKRHEGLDFPELEYPREVVRDAVEENTGERFQFIEHLDFYKDFVPDTKPYEVDARTRALADICLVLFNTNEFAYVY